MGMCVAGLGVLGVGAIYVITKNVDVLSGFSLENRNRLSIRLSLEEVLLKLQERFGADAECTLKLIPARKLAGRPSIVLELAGEAFDPLEDDTAQGEDFGDWSRRTLAGIGLCPVYSYEKGRNLITLRLKKPKRNPLVSLGISIALALLVGLLGSALLPESAMTVALDKLIVPVYDTFLGVLQAIAGPMVFLAVAWGIYSIGDISVLGRIGKRMLGRFIGYTFLMVGFTGLVCLLLFRPAFASSGIDSSQLWSIFDMLLDIFPDNIIAPFQNGNSLQIILCAILVGGAMLILGKQTKVVASLIEQINLIVQFLVEMISNLIPFFIFIVLVQMIWSDSLSVALQAWKPLLIFLGIIAAILVLHLITTGKRFKLSPLLLVRKCLQTFIIALTTASSTASFCTVQHCLDKRMGVNKGIISFGVPLGIVFYAPFTSVYFLILNFYLAEVYGVEISVAWILTAMLISVILTIAAPPIPCGSLSCYTVMFTQLGIPLEALAVALALDVVLDFLATSFDMVELELQLTDIAGRMNKLDLNILRRSSR